MHDKEQLKIYKKTSSKTYIEWLYNYILSLPGKEFDDVDVLEQPQTDDTKKAALLSYFLVYVHELAQQQNIKSHIDIDNEFEELNYNIKIFDKFFNIRNMTGNFDITLMREITMPRTPYVIVL